MRRVLVPVALAACAPGAVPPPTAPAPVVMAVPVSTAADPLEGVTADRRAAATAAWQAGWMPLQPTGVPAFRERYPDADGRGVLIAILDSGIDPSVPGLAQLPDGGAKLLDLRDFSGEGRIALAPVARDGDILRVGGRALAGASRLAAWAAGPIWGGALAERDLGKAPAADVNGNGSVGDSLLVIVVRGINGWMAVADRRGDGSIADDEPVRDFAVAREWFGWSPPGKRPGVAMVVNLADSAGTPVLDLLFDTSGHGTHVAGIAAGHDLYGVAGFDGVAPGAMLLGVKIANDADGGVTVPGSMIRALQYAIGVARQRALPLVVNLSFGVGNEEEGAARIDALVDSVLAANPDVVMTVASSNDGPGLSTLGFPGSAARVLSVGATQPLVFSGLAPDDPTPDPIAYFSSRGGELAGPDLVVPGTAWSSVPRFNAGEEQNSGTSMAAPHAAGLAARLISLARAEGSPPSRAVVMQALRNAARPIPGASVLDMGAGVPDLLAAAQWLRAHATVPVVTASHGGRSGRAGMVLDGPEGPAVGEVTLRRLDAVAPVPVRLELDAPWVTLEGQGTERIVGPEGTTVRVRVAPEALVSPGVRTATLGVHHATDEGVGVLAVVPITVRVPLASEGGGEAPVVRAGPGAAARMPFLADTGRGLQVEVGTLAPDQLAIVALHEPGGQPFRDGSVTTAGHRDGAALFEIDAGDVVAGMYEVVVVAPPTGGTAARVKVRRAPVRLGAMIIEDSLEVHATSMVTEPLVVRLRTALTGAARRVSASGNGLDVVRVTLPVPRWASRVTIDASMPRAAWPAFTDFALTLRDRVGNLLQESPLNYAFGRLATDIPPALQGDSVVIHFRPAPARAGAAEPWALDVDVRFTADRPWALDDGGTSRATLAPGAVRRARFPLEAWPLALPEGFLPLVTVVALEGDDAVWTRELPLRGAGGPTR